MYIYVHYMSIEKLMIGKLASFTNVYINILLPKLRQSPDCHSLTI